MDIFFYFGQNTSIIALMQWNEFRNFVQYLPKEELDEIQQAFELGGKMHIHQKRKSGEPYFTHPIAVARLLAGWGADKDTIIAALLHDTIEDTELTLPQIEKQFGSVVATLVDGVTKLNYQDLDDSPSLNERVETLRKMFTLMQEDVRIMVVKLADRLHNMQTISFRPPDKQKMVAQETLDIYMKIADRLSMFDVSDELEALCLAVLEPDAFAELREFRNKNQEQSIGIAAAVKTVLHAGHEKIFRDVTIASEPRTWKKLRRQLLSGGAVMHNVAGAALSFVCNDIDTCYLVLGALHQAWQRETLSFQDFINTPQLNGYQGLHTTIILDNGLRIRCKIRTQEMQKYAHKGITTKCFDTKSKGLFEYLPWAKRISPLSKDTEDRSDEFWRSLQNDILGDAILIHGDGSHTQLLPTNATALDAVFYLYGEKGLYAEEIYMDNLRVPFYEELSHTCTIYAKFASSRQVKLDWLEHTRTGLSIAFIRNALAKEDRRTKISVGKRLLEEHFHSHKRGFISELDQKYIKQNLSDQKHTSLEAIYEQIAEGRMSPQEAENILLHTEKLNEKTESNKQHLYSISCDIPAANKNTVWNILQFYSIQSLTTVEQNSGHKAIKFTLLLTDEEVRTLSLALDHSIPKNYRIVRSSTLYNRFFFTALLLILWGFDPAMTHVLLDYTRASPPDMTILFYMTTTVLSGCFLLWIRARRVAPEAKLSVKNPSLWMSAILLFFVIYTTYAALQNTLPSHYTIPMTAAGLLLTSIVNRKHNILLSATWLAVISGIILMILGAPQWHWVAMLLTALSVVSFTCFSIVSEGYKRKEQVSLRAAQYFFLLSVVGMTLCLPLMYFSSLHTLSLQHIALIVLSVIFVSGLPYYIYYFLLSRKEIDVVLRYSFLIIPGTVLSEMLLIGMPSFATLLSAIIVALGAFLPIAYFNRLHRKQKANGILAYL